MEQTFYSIHDYYISHHGVKGQKWGIRRYQNPDGTLTAEGKERYGTLKNYYEKQGAKRGLKAMGVYVGGMASSLAAGALLSNPYVYLGGLFASIIGTAAVALTGDTTSSLTAKGDRARRLVEEEGRSLASQVLSTGTNNKEIQMLSGDLSKYIKK